MTQPTLPGIPPELSDRKITTTYHIDLIGKGWYMQTGAMDYTINDRQIKHEGDDLVAGDLYIEEDEDELSAIDGWLSVNTGDFSQIIGTRITKSERATYPQPSREDGWQVVLKFYRETILRDFTEEQSDEYNDCMYGGSDDDD